MNAAALDWVIVGCFGRVHGIQGYVKIQSYTDPFDNILKYTPWYTFSSGQWQPLELVDIKINGKNLLAHVKNVNAREDAAQLTHKEIAIPREALTPLKSNEYYCCDLIGMNVVNEEGHDFGSVIEILSTGSNDVLVTQAKKKHLIPYLLDSYILSIDKEKRLITVNWDINF